MSERFWSKVDKKGPDECWHWKAHSHQRGYGIFWHKGKNIRANRFALMIAKGEPKFDGAMALHSCDNPPCCNPRHLRWGTPKDNADDRDLRNRGNRGNAKTTEFTISEIWRMRTRGYTCGEIAEKLHLSRSHTMNIYTGRAWAHLLGVNGNPTLEELRDSRPRKKRISANRIITDELAGYILKSRIAGVRVTSLAREMDMPVGTISPVYYGLALTELHGINGNPTLGELRACKISPAHQKLDDADRIVIRSLIKDGRTGRSIAAEYGISTGLVSLIKNGKR